MTAQAMEVLYIDGKRNYMASEPFNIYLETLDDPPNLIAPHTGCWRGYFGRWKIKDDKLYLTGMEAFIAIDGKEEEIGLDYFFPDQKIVFAEWFSGEIRVPVGKEIQYVHMGYESMYEKDLRIHIEEGVVISKIEVENI